MPWFLRTVALVAWLATLLPGAAAAQDDWDVPGGHFFTQTGGGGGKGYVVSDEGGLRFWSEFQRLGGVAAVGYPASQRFSWDGFAVQVFQRVIFQWRPECGCVTFVNVLDRLHDAGKDPWLLAARQTPKPRDGNDAGRPWPTVVGERLALLDADPAIKAKYFGVVGDPIQANGLPTSAVTDMGDHYALRTQRAVFQQWKRDVPWARAGEVTLALGGDLAKEAGVLPNPAALLPITAPAPVPPARHRVLAYYVPYDATSWASLEAHPEAIDAVGAQWVTIDACGNLGSRDDQTLVQFAGGHGIRVFPSLLTGSGWLNHRLLTDESVATHAIDQIVEYTTTAGYDGFDLDLEGVDAQDRAAYTAFVAGLGRALHERGKTLALALPAKSRDVTTGWAGAYEYAALGEHADLITIMTYDDHGSWGGPGPVAPYDWVDAIVAFATSQMPAHKVLVGLAFYGYDWNLTSGGARALGYPQAAALAEWYQVPVVLDSATRSATFGYRAPAGDPGPARARPPALQHQITERAAPPCPIGVSPPPPPTPRPTPPADEIQEHVVWLEESASAAARLQLVDRYQAGGVATWRLGLEDPQVWGLLQQR